MLVSKTCIMNFSPSEETALISLCGSSEPGPTGKSSSRESTSLRPDMEERERCGLLALWGELSLPGGKGETRGGVGDGERAEGLKWAWGWPVNRKGELRRAGEAGERGGARLEEDERGTAAGGGVESTFWLLLLNFCKRGTYTTGSNWKNWEFLGCSYQLMSLLFHQMIIFRIYRLVYKLW